LLRGLAVIVLLLPTVARAELRLKRVMFLAPSAYGSNDYHPIADMDHDGLLEMAYMTGRVGTPTDPTRWEYGRFLPFNRWQLLYADTLTWLPPSGLQPGSCIPYAMGDADHDGLNEILGRCWAYFYDTATGRLGDSEFVCTMEQRSPTGLPDTVTWLHYVYPYQEMILQLPGDLDGDGHDDILSWAWSDSLRGHYMLENRGDNSYVRTWTPSGRIAIGRSVAFGDCDMDGRIEFMTSHYGRALFWEASGDDEYVCVFEDTVLMPAYSKDCFFGRDVNQNGKPEFFQTISLGLICLFMWESDADNHYVRTAIDSVRLWQPNRSMCGDIDGDGIDEVVWNTTDYLRIYKAAPGEPLRCVATWLNDHDPNHTYEVNVNIADVNYNGYGDMLVACKRKLSVLEIEAVSLLAPNNRVTYKAGDTCRISWQTFSPPRCDSVSLFLRTDTTYELDTIARGLAPGDTPYVWIVPDIEADSARIMVIAYGPGWQYDESDSPFKIAASGTGLDGPRVAPPRQWALSVNPNPARGGFSVSYEVPCRSRMSVGLYDAGGRLVRSLADGVVAPGRYEAMSAAGTLPAGIYFCTLESDERRLSRKVVLAE